MKYAGDVSGHSRVILIQTQAGLTNPQRVKNPHRVPFYNTLQFESLANLKLRLKINPRTDAYAFSTDRAGEFFVSVTR